MTTTTKNLLSILFFIFSLFFLFAANNMVNSNTLLIGANCHHCGSESACSEGGQAYGYHACDMVTNPSGPDDCGVQGPANCGTMEPT